MTDGGVPIGGKGTGGADLERAALALVAAVAAVTTVGTIAGAPDGETTLVDPDHLGPRLVLLAVVLTAVVGLVLFAVSAQRPWVRVLAVLSALVITGLVVGLLEAPPAVDAPFPDPPEVVDDPPPPDRDQGVGEPVTGDVEWGRALLDLGQLLLAASVLIAIGAAAWLAGTWLGERIFGWERGGTRRSARQAATSLGATGDRAAALRTELAAEIDHALDTLPLAGDPRTVVVAAYVRMTDTLADHGIARAPSDTPRDYLRRALAELGAAADAATRLTVLCEEAMFSTHPISTGGAAAAVQAFEEVRDGLRSPAPPSDGGRSAAPATAGSA
jgi:hypothetical protein